MGAFYSQNQCNNIVEHTKNYSSNGSTLSVATPHIFDISLINKPIHKQYVDFVVTPEFTVSASPHYVVDLDNTPKELNKNIKSLSDEFKKNVCSFFSPQEIVNLVAAKVQDSSDLSNSRKATLITNLSEASFENDSKKSLKNVADEIASKKENTENPL
jgi:hypothetical protein